MNLRFKGKNTTIKVKKNIISDFIQVLYFKSGEKLLKHASIAKHHKEKILILLHKELPMHLKEL